MDYDKDFVDLAEHLGSKVNDTLAVPGNKGLAYLKNVLLCTLVNVKAATLLHKNKIPNLDYDQHAWEEYVAHIRRSFLIDIWSTAESYCREIVVAEELDIEGQQKETKKILVDAIEKSNQEEVKALIRKAKRKLGGNFVEFPRIQKEILDLAKISTTERDKWDDFLNCVRNMRNAAHNNFIIQKDATHKTEWFEFEFIKGESLKVSCSEIKNIIDGFIEFYLLLAANCKTKLEAEYNNKT